MLTDKIQLHLFGLNFAFELTDFIKSGGSPLYALSKNIAPDFMNRILSKLYLLAKTSFEKGLIKT